MIAIYGRSEGPQILIYYHSFDPGAKQVYVAIDDDFYLRKEFTRFVVDSDSLPKLNEELFGELPARFKAIWSYLALNMFCIDISLGGPEKYSRQIQGLQAPAKHPENGTITTIENAIMSLNDGYGWSRERIADWLETLDNNPIIKPVEEFLYV